MKKNNIGLLTQAALIAAIYVVLTVVFAPFGFGEIQVRISEMMTILPYFTPAGIPGIFLGCLIGNLLGGAVLPDIIFGSLASLIGALGTYFMRRKPMYLAPLPPILANVLIVPLILKFAYGVPLPIPLMMLTVGVGELISAGILGLVLGKVLARHKENIWKQN